MIQEERGKLLRRMESMLGSCRRRIKMAEVSACLLNGLVVCFPGLLVISCVFLLIRLLSMLLYIPFGIEAVHALLVAAVFVLAVFGRAIFLGIFGTPVHIKSAAERLDLSQSTHNRIATAMELLRAGDDSSFAFIAIREGFEHLEKLQAEIPYIEHCKKSWRGSASLLILSVIMLAAGQFLTLSPSAGSLYPAPLHSDLSQEKEDSKGLIPEKTGDDPDIRSEDEIRPKASGLPAKLDLETDGQEKSEQTDLKQKPESAGPVVQNASGSANGSRSSSSSRSASGGAKVKADPGKSDPGKPKKSKRPGKKKGDPPDIDQNPKKGGGIDSRGSSGISSMLTTQNDWSNKVKGKSNEDDDSDEDEELDEEADLKKQRIGVQPALKNRSSRISRELSLMLGSKPSEEANRGRGGPSAPKKSRGTATMIMGVPVPGFVKGTLMPGPTKSTQEKIAAVPREAPYADASILRPTTVREQLMERYHPSADEAIKAREYLIKLHAKHETKQKEDRKDE